MKRRASVIAARASRICARRPASRVRCRSCAGSPARLAVNVRPPVSAIGDLLLGRTAGRGSARGRRVATSSGWASWRAPRTAAGTPRARRVRRAARTPASGAVILTPSGRAGERDRSQQVRRPGEHDDLDRAPRPTRIAATVRPRAADWRARAAAARRAPPGRTARVRVDRLGKAHHVVLDQPARRVDDLLGQR